MIKPKIVPFSIVVKKAFEFIYLRGEGAPDLTEKQTYDRIRNQA